MQPRSLGPYLLERRLGAGGFAAVWAARHQESGARHALKVIELPGPEEALRFQREAEALLRLEGHPGAVRVHAAFCVGATAVLAMELIEGAGDLAARLRASGPLPPREAARLVRDVARAVEHAHGRGVLHRDIKPANVLLDPEGRPRLVDLGLAAVSGERSLTRTGEVMGTPGYAAPEQALGRRCDERTDVFGLGALLFACLTGRAPREGPNALGLLLQAGSQALPPVESLRPDAPPALCALVRRATALVPAARHSGAGALAGELDAFLGGHAGPGRRRVALLTGLGALLALGVAWLLLARPAPAPATGPPPLSTPGPAASPLPLADALTRFLATPDDAAGVAAAARALQETLEPLPHAELEGTRAGLAAAVLAVQARLVRGASLARDLGPEAVEDELIRLALAWKALGGPASRAGLDPTRLRAARLATLDEQSQAWERRLERALREDATRPWRAASDDERVPAPWARAALRLLRAVQAPGDGPPALGGRLRAGIERLVAAEVARLDGEDRTDAWMRRALALYACEAWRFYGVDRTPSPSLTAWDPGQLPALQGSAWYHLAQVRAGAVQLVDRRLARLDAQLRGMCPESRLLALAGLESGEVEAGQVAPLVAIALGSTPGVLDDLAPERATAARESAREVLAHSRFRVAARAVARARELMVERPAAALEIGAAVQPAVEVALAAAGERGGGPPHGLLLSAGALLCELGALRGREADLLRATELLRAAAAGFGAAAALDARLARAEAEVVLASALLQLEALRPPGAGLELLRQAEELARPAEQLSRMLDKGGLRWRARLVGVRAVLARRRSDPGVSLAEVERLLAEGLVQLSVGKAEGERLQGADEGTWGLWGRTLVEAALAAGDLELARRRLDEARQRAERHPEWGSGPHLDRLVGRLAAPR